MEKIDFVITWVDGSDPAWQAEKARYQPASETDDREIRYRDWDLLRYWFRAVEQYAPWVNRIHFVTWGHVPAWLNLEHPKLHVATHDSFIPQEYLPTFSSHPIELNMHRIEGLAERFVYFNDDFYLTAPVKPEDFFRDGLPCDSLEEAPLDLCARTQMVRIKANDMLFTNAHFAKNECRKKNPGKWYSLRTPDVAMKNLLLTPIKSRAFFGLKIHHLPQAYRKTTMEKAWQADPDWLHETCLHKFRHDDDVSPHIFKFWQLAEGSFAPYDVRKAGRWYPAGTNCREACELIRERKVKYLCYNDNELTPEAFAAEKEAIHAAFREVLPDQCGFER